MFHYEELSEIEIKDVFIKGLKEEGREKMSGSKPRTLLSALQHAECEETITLAHAEQKKQEAEAV